MKQIFNNRALFAITDLIDLAVIILSKSVDVGRDHLIHRKRSPFPYEGKDLTRLKVGVIANVEQLRLSQTSSTANAVPLLLQGEGLSAR